MQVTETQFIVFSIERNVWLTHVDFRYGWFQMLQGHFGL